MREKRIIVGTIDCYQSTEADEQKEAGSFATQAYPVHYTEMRFADLSAVDISETWLGKRYCPSKVAEGGPGLCETLHCRHTVMACGDLGAT